MTPIERELRTFLDERASSYGVRAAMPRSVARRARTYRAATAGAAGALVAAIVATAFLAPGRLTSAEPVRPVAPRPSTSTDGDAASVEVGGGTVEGGSSADPQDVVARGTFRTRRWTMWIEPQDTGQCLTVDVTRQQYAACSTGTVGDGRAVRVMARVSVRRTGAVGVFGYASTHVDRVVATTAPDGPVRALLVPTGDRTARQTRAWIAFVARDEPVVVEAFGDGDVLLRRVRLPADPGPFGP